MVGPGTGVAPFVGFLEHKARLLSKRSERQIELYDGFWRGSFNPTDGEVPVPDEDTLIENDQGEIYLYFGCRHPKQDFLFKDEIQDYVESGILQKFDVVFSRYREEDHNPRYVYESLRKQGKMILDLLVKKEGYFFVCGGLNMSNSVHDELLKIFQEHGNMTKDEAIEYLRNMILHGRYMKDVWG